MCYVEKVVGENVRESAMSVVPRLEPITRVVGGGCHSYRAVKDPSYYLLDFTFRCFNF